METKQLIVTPPEGYEIDKENSTLECIKFKKKTNVTYKDVVKNLFFKTEVYYINSPGDIDVCDSAVMYEDRFADPDKALSKSQLRRILALNQLFNIAKYYNGDWEPTSECRGYLIDYIASDEYCTTLNVRFMKALPRFRREQDAQAVIHNPNFRPILDSIFK